jgi:beta-lactamase superfamily II metal-dependent hydrolase
MDIITANVGQGALAIARHQGEAIIIDSRIPSSDDDSVAYVKEILAMSLKSHNVQGLVLTGFDNDHCDIVGTSIVLRKYRPSWVMYPTYFKGTRESELVFKLIEEQVYERKNSTNPLRRVSVRVDTVSSRMLSGLSTKFTFELFSPHIDDMDNSNNSSIVLKLTGMGTSGFSYLITGDTETERWAGINRYFGSSLKSHVMAAPHHGSKNALHPGALLNIEPHTVLISAGVGSQYGHPSPEAVRLYGSVAKYVFSTNAHGGVSLLTKPGTTEISTVMVRRLAAAATA